MSSAETINTERGYKLFIQSAWIRLAAIAWKEYLLHGRGALIIDITSTSIKGPDSFESAAEVSYFALDRAHSKPDLLKHFCMEDEIRSMGSYNPEQEIIFVILLPDGGINSFITPGPPSPPECFFSLFRARPVSSSLAAIN